MSTNTPSPELPLGIQSLEEINFSVLGRANMSDLAQVFDSAMDRTPVDVYHELNTQPLVTQLADYITSKTVELVRTGTYVEVADAASALAHSVLLRSMREEELEDPFNAAYRTQESDSIVLTHAASPASRGGELMVVRSQAAAQLFCAIHDSEDRHLTSLEVHTLLGKQPTGTTTSALETAGAIERIGGLGGRSGYYLGPRGYDNPELEALARHFAESPDTQS